MKKGLILFLLGLLVYNSVGFIINFQCVLAEWRREMHGLLPKNVVEEATVSFVFKKTDFDASTVEFSKDGKRYDVVKTVLSHDNIVVYCFKDEEESRITAEFDALLFQNTAANTDFQKKMTGVFKHLFSEYLFDTMFELKTYPSVFDLEKSVFTNKNTCFLMSHLDIITPPPRRAA